MNRVISESCYNESCYSETDFNFSIFSLPDNTLAEPIHARIFSRPEQFPVVTRRYVGRCYQLSRIHLGNVPRNYENLPMQYTEKF